MYNKQGHALKNWVEGLSDEAFYPWESPKKVLALPFPMNMMNMYFSV